MEVGLVSEDINNLLIIAARQTSSRFPNKVLKKIDGLPSIVYQYQRINNSKLIDHALVAVPENINNKKLVDTLNDFNVPFFRGSEENLFQRFFECAESFKSKNVIRVNGDCPLISSSTIDDLILFFEEQKIDYASTIMDESYPLGEHVEIFSFEAFEKASNLELKNQEKEHLTPIFYKNKNIFRCKSLLKNYDFPDALRLCVDYLEDYEFILKIVENLNGKQNFQLIDIIDFVNKEKSLLKINGKYKKDKIIK